MRAANDILRFVLELCAMVALFVGALALGGPLALRIVIGLAAVVGAAAAWGLFVAPRRRVRRGEVLRAGVEAVVFGVAALGLVLAGRLVLAVVFVGVVVVNSVTTRLWPSSLGALE